MPIYEYECKKCGRQVEAFQGFSDPPLTECESCHGKLRKLISQSTFHLKGTGWYVTDYASKSGANQAQESKSKSEDTSAKTAKPKDTAKTSDKPAKKAADK